MQNARSDGDGGAGKRKYDVLALFDGLAGQNSCICTGIFCQCAKPDKMPANMQVNLKLKPEMGLEKEKRCIFASFQPRKADIGIKRCIFAGFALKER
ncbi:hypothetical protein ACFSR7_33060 [Cohnella sp. GCM10020058]|uniref:hypothetical protein n=1 Tax=Cohnella sp. GCM10020058 TaxID=3317330 RepID=UPI00363658A6